MDSSFLYKLCKQAGTHRQFRHQIANRSIGPIAGSGVRMSLSRRSLIQCAALTGISMSGAGPSGFARAQDNRLSKAVAKYQTHPNGIQRCGICLQFEPPGHCKLVSGEISPKGWCRYFAAKENAS